MGAAVGDAEELRDRLTQLAKHFAARVSTAALRRGWLVHCCRCLVHAGAEADAVTGQRADRGMHPACASVAAWCTRTKSGNCGRGGRLELTSGLCCCDAAGL